jgi:hypothetical protein
VTEDPLPDMPVPDSPAGTSPPAGVRAARYHPRSRQLCSDCTAAIHCLGVEVAPFPRPVRWRVSKGSLSLQLCEAHKTERLESWR